MKSLYIDGKTKVDTSIEFIRKYEPKEGYFLGFSGGKDSIVLYDLAIKASVNFVPYYSATGIDPPELVKFIRDNYPNVKWKKPKRSFFGMIQESGYPTIRTRWCCDKLKKRPTNNVPLYYRLMGIRAEESSMRAKRGDISKMGKWIIYNPIFRWLSWEIWEYIEDNDLEYCSLYDEGFDRLGCVVCPFFCTKSQSLVKIYRERWPKYYTAFEKAMYKLWTSREYLREYDNARTFEGFLNNWYSGISSGEVRRSNSAPNLWKGF